MLFSALRLESEERSYQVVEGEIRDYFTVHDNLIGTVRWVMTIE